jgi:CRISPR/Cas system-associated endoribonuclease Cas2
MKNKKEITKIILKGILLAGGIAVASTSPYFVSRVLPKVIKYARYRQKQKALEKKKFYNVFYRLKKEGFIKMEYRGKQLYINLTEEGKEKVGKYQIDDLKIKKPLRWDKKWRVLIFDVEEKNRIKREALRGKLKELRLYQLQKSVWVCPYDFFKEMDMLRRFFGLKNFEMKIITASEIEDDGNIKTFFGLK